MAKNTNPFNMPSNVSFNNSFEVKRSADRSGYTGSGGVPNRSLLEEVTDEAYHRSMRELGLESEPEPYVPTEEETLMDQLLSKFGSIEAVKQLLNADGTPYVAPSSNELPTTTTKDTPVIYDEESLIDKITMDLTKS